MIRKLTSSLGAALATILALAVSPAAHAFLTIESSRDSVTYAKETLPTGSAVTVNGTTYYLLGHNLLVGGAAGVGAQAGDTYVVTYTLSGMVFGDGTPAKIGGDQGADGDFNKVTGGAANDASVVYRLKADGTVSVGDSPTNILADFRFAVSASGGSITRTITNESLPAGTPGRSKSATAYIRVATALSETSTYVAANLLNGTIARARSNFLDFGTTSATGSRILKARLGTLQVAYASGAMGSTATPTDTRFRNAARTEAQGGAVGGTTAPQPATDTGALDTNGIVDQLREIMKGLGATDANQSTATVAGDVSFVKRIGFGELTGDKCSSTVTDIRKPATAPATGYTDEFRSIRVNNTAFDSTPLALCLEVDGETPILAGDYTITTSYEKLDRSAFGPVGATHRLGSLARDGTFHAIPYLTTYSGYNQRLILHNRSPRAVSYTVNFYTEMAIAADPMKVEGTLAANEVKVVRVQDIVTLTGGSRTAATVTSNATAGFLEVATTIVNLETRGTDTVKY